MEITKEQYDEILKKQDAGEILLYIDTASFRKFFTEANNKKVKELIGESLNLESFIIKLIMFALEPLSLIITFIASIFLFKWFAILIIPIVFFLWGFLKGQASIGKQKILLPLALLAIGIVIAFSYQEYGLWFKLFIIGLPATYFSSKLLYYLSARFGFMLIHRNYEFFKLFYEKPEGAVIPMIWSEKLK